LRKELLVVLTVSIVILGMTNAVSAASWYFTKPYGYGNCSAIYGVASYDLAAGRLNAGFSGGAGHAAAGLGPYDMGFFLGHDQDVTVSINCRLTAYLDVVPVYGFVGYAEVCVNVYLVWLDGAGRVLDSATAWNYRVTAVFGRQSHTFSNTPIIATVTLNPDDLMEVYSPWRVYVEIFAGGAVLWGYTRVVLSPTQIGLPAALIVNSISVST